MSVKDELDKVRAVDAPVDVVLERVAADLEGQVAALEARIAALESASQPAKK